jgi:hypothetical protein
MVGLVIPTARHPKTVFQLSICAFEIEPDDQLLITQEHQKSRSELKTVGLLAPFCRCIDFVRESSSQVFHFTQLFSRNDHLTQFIVRGKLRGYIVTSQERTRRKLCSLLCAGRSDGQDDELRDLRSALPSNGDGDQPNLDRVQRVDDRRSRLVGYAADPRLLSYLQTGQL